jgi:hypothetical protein
VFSTLTEGKVGNDGSNGNVKCDRGYFRPKGNKKRCEKCSVGTFQANYKTTDDACTPCPAGYTSGEGASSCYACGVGKKESSKVCVWCTPGTGQPNDAGTQCIGCSPGTYSKESTSPRGVCVACPAGQYCESSGMTVEGQTCNSGYYSLAGSSACTACGFGRYSVAQPSLGASSCTACDTTPPTNFKTTGNEYSSSCAYCNPGYGGTGPTGTTCSMCPAGSFANRIKWTATCELCARNYYAPSPGMTACLPCPAGKGTTSPFVGKTSCS